MKKDRAMGIFIILVYFAFGCQEKKISKRTPETPIVQNSPVKTEIAPEVVIVEKPTGMTVPDGMVWVPGSEFIQGAVPQDKMAMEHEKPGIKVAVDGFFMDITEVTNAQFSKFIEETAYITVAERAVDWEELKKQVPEDTEKPHDSVLRPGALTFKKVKTTLSDLYDFSQWWHWKIGADWKHPNGPESTTEGKGGHPVVQIAYEDALAYCKWAGRRLPTEAEWELAARGGNYGTTFFWGDDVEKLAGKANTWEGEFPVTNAKTDGYELRAPVKSYAPNGYGLYDMAGNVWEWTSDWYNTKYYREQSLRNTLQKNPQGAASPYTPNNPYAREKVVKGGSFLCSASYCASYRVSARMGSSMDSSLEHTGFRTVLSVDMIQE
ncbi:formylglycine-generating enzyme family protein [Maribacter sp. 2304DJ31-5]|uniref:formylglycine-generating enzyme family protein n=1 Tax=Maribacter sp. 2304DJ31-5 TaxID=3386273 RepID=UPI0039BC7D12